MNMPCNERIPERLARRRLFHALPAEYLTNTEVEAREYESADDSYAEQQVSVLWPGTAAVIGEGPRACYTDHLAPDCLQKNNHNVEDTIPECVV